jgi:rod shape-determining protein MreC
MELRYVAGNADVEVGDVLYTSGIDGVYPPGLAVGRVAQVERRADSGFARILVKPAAVLDGVRHVLLLQPLGAPEQAADAAGGAEPAEAGSAAAAGAASTAPTAPAKGKEAKP